MKTPSVFFGLLRGSLFTKLEQPQVDGLNAIVAAAETARWPISYAAYALATAFHETGQTMQPVRERGSGDKNRNGIDDWFEKYDTGPIAARLGNTPAADGDGAKYCGRGYVQLTGLRNYTIAAHLVGKDLVGDPDLAMQPDVAAQILIDGMQNGWFTGRKLASYLPAGEATIDRFVLCRQIINSMDRAATIAAYAIKFQAALRAGGYGA